jgi:hypothetical protein
MPVYGLYSMFYMSIIQNRKSESNKVAIVNDQYSYFVAGDYACFTFYLYDK